MTEDCPTEQHVNHLPVLQLVASLNNAKGAKFNIHHSREDNQAVMGQSSYARHVLAFEPRLGETTNLTKKWIQAARVAFVPAICLNLWLFGCSIGLLCVDWDVNGH